MPTEEFSNYRLIFKSSPSLINLNNISIRNFPSITIASDIFGFYPYGTIYFADSGGTVVDKIVFIEGLEFEFKIGNDEDGYVGDNFYWDRSEINNIQIANFISGDYIFIVKSIYDKVDHKRSKAWSTMTLSDAVNNIVSSDYNITDTDKIHIFNTTGSDTWYQINEKNEDFLFKHRKHAYTKNYPYSPYLTFINSNGEFYFTTVESLFNEQQPVESFKFELSEKSVILPDTVKDYSIDFVGSKFHKLDYNKRLYTIDKEASYAYTDNTLDTFYVKHPKGKVLLRRELIEDVSDYQFLGINETTADENRLNGKRNFEFLDSIFPVRLNLTLDFKPSCVTGKLIDLRVESVFDNKQILDEFSGNWLIISDKHFMDYDGKPSTLLTVTKSRMVVDNQNFFYNEFI